MQGKCLSCHYFFCHICVDDELTYDKNDRSKLIPTTPPDDAAPDAIGSNELGVSSNQPPPGPGRRAVLTPRSGSVDVDQSAEEPSGTTSTPAVHGDATEEPSGPRSATANTPRDTVSGSPRRDRYNISPREREHGNMFDSSARESWDRTMRGSPAVSPRQQSTPRQADPYPNPIVEEPRAEILIQTLL